MGRVDWEEAKTIYVTNSKVSYSMLAKHYKVAKPTIQAHASKHKWAELRKKAVEKRTENLLETVGENYEEFETRQLRVFQAVQASSIQSLNLLNEQMVSGKYHHRYATDLASIIRTLILAIDQERLILGIKYKPVRHPNDTGTRNTPRSMPDRIPTIDETIKALDKLIAREERLKKLRGKQRADIS